MSDFSALTALYVNTSLKRSADESHTRLLMQASAGIMRKHGVTVDELHMLDHRVPPGVYPDMTEHGWGQDDWPAIWQRVQAADILIIGTPLWLGEAGPGPSYGDGVDGKRAGFDTDFTRRYTTIMTWNAMHLAKMLKIAGGYRTEGNDRRAFVAGCRFDYENPEYRA